MKPISAEAKAILDKYRHPTKDASTLPIEAVVERCFLRFISEAVHCLESGVIATPRDGDIGAIMGIGFPPFLGGPFMWVDTVGPAVVVEKMEALRAEHGEQFAPPQMLLDKAKAGATFHE